MCSLGGGLGHLHTRAHTCAHITLGDGDVMCGPSPNNAGSLEGGLAAVERFQVPALHQAFQPYATRLSPPHLAVV